MAQNIWTGTKHFGTCKRTRHYLSSISFLFFQFRNAMKGATTPNRSGDNLLQNPPEQLLLRQSIMKRIGRSRDSNTNTSVFKRQQSNQLSQSQSQATGPSMSFYPHFISFSSSNTQFYEFRISISPI